MEIRTNKSGQRVIWSEIVTKTENQLSLLSNRGKSPLENDYDNENDFIVIPIGTKVELKYEETFTGKVWTIYYTSKEGYRYYKTVIT